MKVNTLKLSGESLPPILQNISNPPRQLFWRGTPIDQVLARPRVTIVGSRSASEYGRSVTEDFAGKLAKAGVVIVSGLAFGIDSYAHKAALRASGTTVAILPTPLGKISPSAHNYLAKQILESGGALASEYDQESEIHKGNFIARNRIVSAISDVLLITEAAKNSGSMHTARFALEQGKTVMAVPGSIKSPSSEGTNNLIKSGAVPATSADDIFFALGIQPKTVPAVKVFKGTEEQQIIFNLINSGTIAQEELAIAANMPIPQLHSALTSLELKGYIRPLGAGNWTAS